MNQKTLALCEGLLLLHNHTFADQEPGPYLKPKPQCTAAKVHTKVGNTSGTQFCFNEEGDLIDAFTSGTADDAYFKTYALNKKNAIRKFNQYLKNK